MSCSGTSTVTEAWSTEAQKSCPTYTGDVVIPESARNALLDGLAEIRGSLKVEDVTNITWITSDSLHTVTEDITFDSTIILDQISFPELTSVGTLSFSNMPNLQENTLLSTLSNLTRLEIQDTGIEEIEGFSIQTIEDITIQNNPYMNSINLQPYNITGAMSIVANGQALEVSMPNIESTQNMTFSNCSRVSTPSLRKSFSLLLMANAFSEFSGAPLLQEVDGGLAFYNNQNLTRIALPELRQISGGMQILNNTMLKDFDELYSLETVDGALRLEGAFENIKFPGLDENSGEVIKGAFTVNSTADMDCASIDQYYIDGLIAGKYECTSSSSHSDSESLQQARAAASNNSTEASGQNGASSESDSGGLSRGARAGIGIGVGGGIGALVGGLIGWWFHRRQKARRAKAENSDDVATVEKDGNEVDRANMLGNDRQKFELEGPLAEEMPVGGEAQELPAKHGAAELTTRLSTERKGLECVEGRHEMEADLGAHASSEKTEQRRKSDDLAEGSSLKI